MTGGLQREYWLTIFFFFVINVIFRRPFSQESGDGPVEGKSRARGIEQPSRRPDGRRGADEPSEGATTRVRKIVPRSAFPLHEGEIPRCLDYCCPANSRPLSIVADGTRARSRSLATVFLRKVISRSIRGSQPRSRIAPFYFSPPCRAWRVSSLRSFVGVPVLPLLSARFSPGVAHPDSSTSVSRFGVARCARPRTALRPELGTPSLRTKGDLSRDASRGFAGVFPTRRVPVMHCR